MSEQEIQKILQYSDEWIRLEIITPDKATRLWQEFSGSDDRNLEHYRWRAFKEFLTEQETVSESLLMELYQLGESDVDYVMGGAMMVEVLHHPQCPITLLEAATKSDRKHLRGIASQKLAQRKPCTE